MANAEITQDAAGPSGCPACAAVPSARVLAQRARPAASERLLLSLPAIRCAGCIAGAERALNAVDGVADARVNFTLKRASVRAAPEVTPEMLVRALAQAGIEAHELDEAAIATDTAADRTGRDLLMRLGVAGFASMNVMLLSIAVWSGAEDATRDLFHWISAAIAMPAIVFAGRPFYLNAWAALRHGRLNMDVPITLAIVLAAGTSLWETALSGRHAYFDAALMLTFFLLAGRYLDHRTRATARSAAEELAALEVPRATRRAADGREETVPIGDISVGDVVLVRPGSRMPVDGIVSEGTSELDRALLTGETVPVRIAPGEDVKAGEVNLSGLLVVTVTAVGRDTSLHALTDLVAVAESGRANYAPLADRAAKLYAPGVHILAALAFAGWFFGTQDMRTALNIAAAVLIITCPCALGLAVPAVTTAASGRLFQRGLLVKSPTALERLADADTVVFDKTGTLTAGTPELEAATAPVRDALALAAGIAAGSSHPLAAALVRSAARDGVVPAHVTDTREVPGHGIEARLGERRVRLGRADWIGVAEDGGRRAATWLDAGDGQVHVFRFVDQLRPGAAEAVGALREAGLSVRLLSGDAPEAVADVAARVGIDNWTARATPVDKAAAIGAMQDGAGKVLMVGDGLNDTAALAAAHVSLSPASGLDAARVASDMVLLGTDLSALAEAHAVARRARKRISENFQIATAYNVIAVPLAVAGLATPLIAAAAMSISSITVSLNALRVSVRHRAVAAPAS